MIPIPQDHIVEMTVGECFTDKARTEFCLGTIEKKLRIPFWTVRSFLVNEANDRDHPAAMGDRTILNPHTNRRSVCIVWFAALTRRTSHDAARSNTTIPGRADASKQVANATEPAIRPHEFGMSVIRSEHRSSPRLPQRPPSIDQSPF